jgi:Tripartite tricarboxylate transporter family receptor
MKLPRRNFLHLAAGVAGLPVVSRVAWAQAYPTRPVRIIAPTGPGGAPDIIARLIGPWLSQRLGQQFVVENRPGSGSNIGTEAVVRAAPDGYTLLIASSANTINATLYDKLNFVFLRDIAPVAGISRETGAMVVNPSFPAETVPEFIAYAKAKVGGHRCLHPRSRRAVQDDDRGRHGSCALSWWRARAHRFARRTGAGLLPHHCLIDRVYQGWQAACARSNHRDALGRAARHPDRGRVRAGLRGELLVWRRRSPRTHPPRSSTSSTRQLTPASPIPRSRRGSPIWAACRCRCGPPNSASSSPKKPRSGATSSGPSTSRRTEPDPLSIFHKARSANSGRRGEGHESAPVHVAVLWCTTDLMMW